MGSWTVLTVLSRSPSCCLGGVPRVVLNLQLHLNRFPIVRTSGLWATSTLRHAERGHTVGPNLYDNNIDFVDLLSLELMNYSSLLIISQVLTVARVLSN